MTPPIYCGGDPAVSVQPLGPSTNGLLDLDLPSPFNPNPTTDSPP
jgi:hypothetical protein